MEVEGEQNSLQKSPHDTAMRNIYQEDENMKEAIRRSLGEFNHSGTIYSEKLRNERELKREQDKKYEESLEKDRIKEQQKNKNNDHLENKVSAPAPNISSNTRASLTSLSHTEIEKAQKAAEEARDLAEYIKAGLKNNTLGKEVEIPEEPSESEDDTVTIKFVLPGGTTQIRRFRNSQTRKDVDNYINSLKITELKKKYSIRMAGLNTEMEEDIAMGKMKDMGKRVRLIVS